MNASNKVLANPLAIFESLMQHSTVKADRELTHHLEQAKTIFPEMSNHQFERIVANELAGTIATIIGMTCCKQSAVPVIMVTSPEAKAKQTAMLNKAVSVLIELGHLPATLRVVSKQPKYKYFCMRRFKQAQTSADYSENMRFYETVNRLNKSDAQKMCVQSCSRSCKYFSECRYQLLLAQLSSGDIMLQVYDDRQYRAAYNAGTLPKSRMTICTATGRKVLAQPSAHVLSEAELRDVLARSEMGCGSFKKLKRIVYKNTEAIRADADKLFAMSTNGIDPTEAKTLLSDISERLKLIHSMCKKYHHKEDSSVLAALYKSIRKISAMLDAGLTITCKNQGNRALIAA